MISSLRNILYITPYFAFYFLNLQNTFCYTIAFEHLLDPQKMGKPGIYLRSVLLMNLA